MGGFISRLLESLFSPKTLRILLLGLENAGKTTILFKMKIGEIGFSQPTPGFNVDELRYKNVNIFSWDIGTQQIDRTFLLPFYQNTKCIIFVVDSSDREQIEQAELELKLLLEDDALKNAILLVFANKQDLPDAMTTAELTEKLKLQNLFNRKWFIQKTTAVTKEGIYEGLDWASKELNRT